MYIGLEGPIPRDWTGRCSVTVHTVHPQSFTSMIHMRSGRFLPSMFASVHIDRRSVSGVQGDQVLTRWCWYPSTPHPCLIHETTPSVSMPMPGRHGVVGYDRCVPFGGSLVSSRQTE